jgi:dTDP-4-amino-4,6-dideoxygalactose transaminase
VRHCVGLNSGTDALRLGLLAGGIEPSDEVITSPLTFIATAETANQVGNVRFADVDPGTFNLCARDVSARLTSKTRAVIAVHLYGQPASMPDFEKLAERKSLLLIEDACQAHGASIGGRKVGSFGKGSAFSFYPTKNLSAFGDAGAFTTDSKVLSDRIRLLRNHGQTGPYFHEFEGYNSRMDAFQAVILSRKLRLLDRWNQQRRGIASFYSEGLKDVEGVLIQKTPPDYLHAYHLYPILVVNRDRLIGYLEDHGIQTRVIYPTPIHLMPAYSHLGYQRGDFPNAEEVSSRVLCLPLYPGLEAAEADEVVLRIRRFYGSPV